MRNGTYEQDAFTIEMDSRNCKSPGKTMEMTAKMQPK